MKKHSTEHKFSIYRQDKRLRDPTLSILRDLAREILEYRWHVWINFKRDFSANYRRNIFGVLWAFVNPLVPISVYVLLAVIGVFPSDKTIPPVVYITVGFTLWALMAESIQVPFRTMQQQKTVVNGSQLPVSVIILVGYARICFDTLVRLLAVILIVFVFSPSLSWVAITLPVLLIPVALFALGVGILVAILGLIARDIVHVIDLLLRYGIFISYVLFPLPDIALLNDFSLLNPFATFINNVRSATLTGSLYNPVVYGITSAISIVLFIMACRLLFMMEYRLKGVL